MTSGRKVILTKEIAKQVCNGIEKAGTFYMAESKGYLPHDIDTINRLMRENKEFDEAVQRSRDEGLQNLLEETLSIAFNESRDIITTEEGKIIPNHVAPIRDKLKIDTIHRRIGGARKIHGFAKASTAESKFKILCENFGNGNISPEVANTARSLCEFQFDQEEIKEMKADIRELKEKKG
jgi:hypothetical protein